MVIGILCLKFVRGKLLLIATLPLLEERDTGLEVGLSPSQLIGRLCRPILRGWERSLLIRLENIEFHHQNHYRPDVRTTKGYYHRFLNHGVQTFCSIGRCSKNLHDPLLLERLPVSLSGLMSRVETHLYRLQPELNHDQYCY
jgi:hypothetical protein